MTISSDKVPPPASMLQKKRMKKKALKKKSPAASSSQRTSRPPKSLIRKRPVSFGNPALGTYHGCLYTLDVIGDDYSSCCNVPLIEGAEHVERVVAMVDVPPEQVPEGILNLARSHRPYLHHVRIVTAETTEELSGIGSSSSMPASVPLSGVEQQQQQIGEGEEETKEEKLLLNNSSANPQQGGFSGSSLVETRPTLSVVENAASILALDEEQQAVSAAVEAVNTVETTERLDRSNSSSDEDDNISVPSKTYVVLLELCSVDAAEAFVEDLNGRPYTSLDPTQKCSVYQVLALTGEDGVSLLSPFFAPSARSTSASPKANNGSSNAAKANTKPLEDVLRPGPSSNSSTPRNGSSITASQSKAAKGPSAPAPAPSSIPAPIVEDYNCAVCLEHMILSSETEIDASADARSSILTTVCNHTFHLDCLLQWQDSPCPVCRYDHSGLNEALSQCSVCGTTENNYVCLICGVVSCGGPPIRSQNVSTQSVAEANSRLRSHSPVCGGGTTAHTHRSTDDNTQSHNNDDIDNTLAPAETSRQLSQSHARRHYDESLHAYALDTETQHVWDFAGQGYVHRLLQNKEDGKLVESYDPSNTSSHERSYTPGLSEAQEGEVLHRKLEGFASQYYTLLKSQLEQQRSYYQGRLEELRRESLMRKKAQTSDLIHALKQEKAQSSKRLVSLKARHRKVSEDIVFLKNMNESLEANKEPLKCRIKDAQRQRTEAREQMQQSLPALEEKVTKLMLQLTGEPTSPTSDESATASAGDVECAPPQTPPNPKTLERSNSSQSDDRKPAAKR